MRIMNVLVSSKDGGAEKFFMRFGTAMQRREIELLMVMSPHSGRQAYFDAHLTPYVCIDFEKAKGLWGRWRLQQVVSKFNPDVIVAWLKLAPRLLPHSRKAIKIGRVGGYYKSKYYGRCDYIVANSPPIQKFMETQGLPNTCFISNFAEITPSIPMLHGHRRPLIFFHGRLHPQKGLDVLIDALPHIEADVQIAGAGPLEEELQIQAVLNGVADRVDFLGWQDDTWPYLSEADLYVFPSRYEGTSNSLLEAMACGKPIVTTNSESVSWFLTHEENALIVDVDDARQLAQAVSRLIEEPDLARHLGVNARQLYHQRFSEEAICSQWLAFFEAALHTRSTLGVAKRGDC